MRPQGRRSPARKGRPSRPAVHSKEVTNVPPSPPRCQRLAPALSSCLSLQPGAGGVASGFRPVWTLGPLTPPRWSPSQLPDLPTRAVRGLPSDKVCLCQRQPLPKEPDALRPHHTLWRPAGEGQGGTEGPHPDQAAVAWGPPSVGTGVVVGRQTEGRLPSPRALWWSQEQRGRGCGGWGPPSLGHGASPGTCPSRGL